MKNIANCITMGRLLLSPVLIFTQPLSLTFYAVYLLCVLSDLADGPIARRTGAAGSFGAKLDSAADLVMTGALLWTLYPIVELHTEGLLWMLGILLVRLISLATVWVRFKTFAMLHTYSNKATGAALGFFPMLLPIMPAKILVFFVCLLASLSAAEELMIQLTSKTLELDRRGLLGK